jgi:ketosteroid isomerase-like protein
VILGNSVENGVTVSRLRTFRTLPGVSDPAATVERWWNVWYEGDLDTFDEIVADTFVRHGTQGTVVRTREQAKEDMALYRDSMEIAEVHIDARAVSGADVWCRVTTRGVNLKTEEPVTMSWLQECRVEDGRIAEMWLLYANGVDWSAQ